MLIDYVVCLGYSFRELEVYVLICLWFYQGWVHILGVKVGGKKIVGLDDWMWYWSVLDLGGKSCRLGGKIEIAVMVMVWAKWYTTLLARWDVEINANGDLGARTRKIRKLKFDVWVQR